MGPGRVGKSGPSELELLLISLTKREFSLVFTVDRLRDAQEYEGEFSQVDEYETPYQTKDDWGRWNTNVERFRRTIRYLTDVWGWEWTWLDVDVASGSIRRKGEGCEPGNMAYEILMSMAKTDYDLNAKRAALLAEEKGKERLARILYSAAEDIDETARHRIKTADPEAFDRYTKQNDEALATLGVERIQKGAMN